MDERIHEVLDGARSREALEPAAERELAALERAIEGTLAGLPQDGSVEVSGAVLWRVRELAPAPRWLPEPLIGTWLKLRQAAQWVWSPRPLRVRPAVLLGAFALAVMLPLTAVQLRSGGASPEVAAAPRLLVQFRLPVERARDVQLVGDFTGWEARHALEQVSPGVWSIVIPLEPGIYEYGFMVDGERWTLDPLAPSVADGFGGENSRIAVLAPEAGSAL